MFNYYVESADITKLKDEEVKLLRREYSITVDGSLPPRPIRYFEDVWLLNPIFVFLCATSL
jgi:hypothetical protein